MILILFWFNFNNISDLGCGGHLWGNLENVLISVTCKVRRDWQKLPTEIKKDIPFIHVSLTIHKRFHSIVKRNILSFDWTRCPYLRRPSFLSTEKGQISKYQFPIISPSSNCISVLWKLQVIPDTKAPLFVILSPIVMGCPQTFFSIEFTQRQQ